MFAYCANNPICFLDPSGTFGVAAFQKTRDGIFRDGGPVGGGAGLLSPLALVLEVINSLAGTRARSLSNSYSKEEEKTHVIADTITKEPDNTAIFTPNPYDFNPRGLNRHVYVEPGKGSNGGIIKWEIPGTKIAIFEWNEDWRYGPHYHTLKIEWKNEHLGPHHPIGSEVPEPWKSAYF